ncbi:hypothetical protein KP509_18G055300 [Ceratopteris richardii]|uniref:hydroxymethylglutaryl-CoA reductase (NADPH) n=1 Tax=Ceratopteris richardii TaxID=49495 RepID=A0A8T2SRQ6_CERRI|nr:hypothetical protein KP509_18G055300 [Ceratopteris richardii]
MGVFCRPHVGGMLVTPVHTEKVPASRIQRKRSFHWMGWDEDLQLPSSEPASEIKRPLSKIKRSSSFQQLYLASDALPLPLALTNKVFVLLFIAATYFLLKRWNDKRRSSIPLHVLSFGEILAIIAQIGSVIYLFGFFGISYVQGDLEKEEDEIATTNCSSIMKLQAPAPPAYQAHVQLKGQVLKENSDEDIASAVASGQVPSYSLEAELGDCERATSIRKTAVEMMTSKKLDGLPLSGFDYSSVLGQCCEMVVGYVQLPVGVAGPLTLNGRKYMIPMATTEGCLVSSTNRGCKAISLSGGASSILLKDGMTRAPVVSFPSARRAAELKFFVDALDNMDMLCNVFNSSSRFAKLQSIQATLAGRNVYLRFRCFTGDAMGMNMVSKGVQKVLDYLQRAFPDMDIVSISGNYCADKKATAINWIEGRGKSVVCEAVIKEEVVSKVLKTTVPALVQLNTLKNLTGSAMAGAMGGFNAHAANIVSAVFIATGQDPAQNIESSQCITLMEHASNGRDLYISVTMPAIEVRRTIQESSCTAPCRFAQNKSPYYGSEKCRLNGDK